MPNPFTPYLPMYAPGSLPERPWWRRSDGTWPIVSRVDGLTVVGDNPDGRMEWIAYTSNERHSAEVLDRTDWPADPAEGLRVLLAFLERIDAAHPLPAPPPMVGQVWHREDGLVRMVTEIYAESSIDGHDFVLFGARQVMVARSGVTPMPGTQVWPPAYAVLVLGPTPWGRDCPWASAGWRP